MLRQVPDAFLRVLLFCVPAVLHAQADTRSFSGLRCGHVAVLRRFLSVLVRRLHRNVGHAQNARLHVEALRHLGAGVLHGHDGDLPHLVGAACDLFPEAAKKTLVSEASLRWFSPRLRERLLERRSAKESKAPLIGELFNNKTLSGNCAGIGKFGQNITRPALISRTV